MVEKYKESCSYILQEFQLPPNSSIYTLVSTITEAYKLLKDEKFLAENPIVEAGIEEAKLSVNTEKSQKEKKRGRPRKS